MKGIYNPFLFSKNVYGYAMCQTLFFGAIYYHLSPAM